MGRKSWRRGLRNYAFESDDEDDYHFQSSGPPCEERNETSLQKYFAPKYEQQVSHSVLFG